LSDKLIIERALQRQEIFRNLPKYLRTIKITVQKLDPKAKVYLFGSVAEEKNNYSSDIDILVTTNLNAAIVHSELWKAGIKEPFEVLLNQSEE